MHKERLYKINALQHINSTIAIRRTTQKTAHCSLFSRKVIDKDARQNENE
jgi:hypothetical protein